MRTTPLTLPAPAPPEAPAPSAPAVERRGREPQYVSYWERLRRRQRARIFQGYEAGEDVESLAAELALSTGDVLAVLATDGRRRPSEIAAARDCERGQGPTAA